MLHGYITPALLNESQTVTTLLQNQDKRNKHILIWKHLLYGNDSYHNHHGFRKFSSGVDVFVVFPVGIQ